MSLSEGYEKETNLIPELAEKTFVRRGTERSKNINKTGVIKTRQLLVRHTADEHFDLIAWFNLATLVDLPEKFQ